MRSSRPSAVHDLCVSEEIWIPFDHREFYDYPRVVVVEIDATRFVLDSPFDDALDDYVRVYTVWRTSTDFPLSGSWVDVTSGGEKIGEIKIREDLFDVTRRRLIRWDLIVRELGRMEVGL